MNIKTELHNLKTMVLSESHISDNAKEKISNRIFEIEKRLAINYTGCCESDSELLKVLEYTRQVKNNPKEIQLLVDKLYIENL